MGSQVQVSALLRMPAKDQGFTEDQIEDFKEVFQLFDTKGDGLIQVNQVGEVLRALGTNPTEGEVKKLIQSSCKEKDARVTFEMFWPMLQDVSSKPIRDTVDDFVEGARGEDERGGGGAVDPRQGGLPGQHQLRGVRQDGSCSVKSSSSDLQRGQNHVSAVLMSVWCYLGISLNNQESSVR